MRNLEPLIDTYLNKQTQHAIQIVGPWGRGKTHYYRNVLQNRIAATATIKDNTIKYKPVYISLFGIRSIEDIQIKIFHELLYQFFTTKKSRFSKAARRKLNITARLMKLIVRGYLTQKGLKDVTEYTTEVMDLAKDVIDTTDIVVCFDDLERKSNDLLIEDFTGYVNNLVEEGVKVLIICNEDKLKDEAYRSYKEKVVGVTYVYNPETGKVIDNIISSRYLSFDVFSKFLQSIKPLLVELAEKNDHNYRHMIYCMDSLHDIYSILKKDVLDSNKDWVEKCKQELNHVAKFILTTAIEFKASVLSYSDHLNMRNTQFSDRELRKMEITFGTVAIDTESSPKKDKFTIFIDKYYEQENEYNYYDSIFTYVTGEGEFNVDQFEREFKNNYRLEEGKVLPQYQILNELNYMNSLKLTDEVYKEKTLKMIEYAKAGLYRLSEYLTIYFYAGRFGNLLEISLDELKSDLINAMTLIAQQKKDVLSDIESSMNFQHITTEDDGQEEIRKHGLSIYKTLKADNEAQKMGEIISVFLVNLDGLHDKFHQNQQFRLSVESTEVLKLVDPDKLFEQMLSVKPFAIEFFIAFIDKRYDDHRIKYRNEEATLQKLQSQIAEYLDKHPEKSLKNYVLKKLHQKLAGFDYRFNNPMS